LALAGVGFLTYPWLSDLYARGVVQHQLRAQFSSPEARIAYQRHEVKEGEGLTRIVIPRLGVDTIVVQGTSPSALRAGAGHYPETPLPGEAGNMAIAGHRTTYGKPFADIDQLSPGDEIDLETPLGSFVYRVTKNPFVITPTDRSVLGVTPDPTLTLTACHPKFSAAERLVVQAHLDSAAAPPPGPSA
jgi:sortase A